MPGAGGTQRLPRRVPLGAARELLLLGRTVDAETALRALATRAIKRAVSAELEQGLDREGELFRGLLRSADAREGVAAFGERREPRFNSMD
jgi:enoyl-CoA hydratase/carnithine racemase